MLQNNNWIDFHVRNVIRKNSRSGNILNILALKKTHSRIGREFSLNIDDHFFRISETCFH